MSGLSWGEVKESLARSNGEMKPDRLHRVAQKLGFPALELVESGSVTSDATVTKVDSAGPERMGAAADVQPEPHSESQGPQANERTTNFYHLKFMSPECRLSHSVLPDGTARVVQTAPDGSIRTQLRRGDGTGQDMIADRYGRPAFVCELNIDGTWATKELRYDKLSPFASLQRVTSSDGTVEETHYSPSGRVSTQRVYTWNGERES